MSAAVSPTIAHRRASRVHCSARPHRDAGSGRGRSGRRCRRGPGRGHLPLADPVVHATVLRRAAAALEPALGPAAVVPLPALGGLIFGPLIYFFAREAKGHGVPEVMLAVAQRGGRIRPAVAVVKSLASALCIGSGGSVGREGPIVQIGSALGSTLGPGLPHVRRPDAHARRLRRGRRHRGDLQRPDRRRLLRPRGDPRRVHHARLRRRRDLQRHRLGDRPRRLRQRARRSRCRRYELVNAGEFGAVRAARRSSPARSASPSPGRCTAFEDRLRRHSDARSTSSRCRAA